MRLLEQSQDLPAADYYFLLARAIANGSTSTTAEKEWKKIRLYAAMLEFKRIEGTDKGDGVRQLLPPGIVPDDAFEFGDRSL